MPGGMISPPGSADSPVSRMTFLPPKDILSASSAQKIQKGTVTSMSSYQIITDSTCDFRPESYSELGLIVQPLIINFRGKTARDRSDDSIQEVYAGLRNGEVATTSAINPEEWVEVVRPTLEQGKDALIMAFSSGLSTTYRSAVIAAQELTEQFPDRKVLVCDTLSASLGEGLLVWYACKKRDEGLSLEELYHWVEENKLHICHWFTVDDLMYLKRGGRISAATALLGTMLSIKPVLHTDDEGHLINMSKARGRKASIQAIADKMGELGAGYDNSTVFICHGDCIDDAKYLEKLVREQYGVKNVYINYTGAVIGSHSGPGTLALFFMGSHR